MPIFSISKQKGWYNWACKLPCKNPYFIGKIRVRVCEIEWTLTTDKPAGLLRRKYASTESWIGDELISSAWVNPQQQDAQSEKDDALREGGVRWSCRFAGLIAFLCRRECLIQEWFLSPLGRIATCFLETAAHAPGIPKLLITVPDEHGWIW